MNRLVWDGASALGPEAFPPARDVTAFSTNTRGGADPSAPVRVLFIHGRELGFGTTARSLQRACESRTDIDAVHASFAISLPARILGKQLPKWLQGWDFHRERITWASGRSIERSMRRGIPLDRFDVVHIMTRERAWIVRHRRPGDPKFVVNVDTTSQSWDRAYEVVRSTPPLDARLDREILRAADAVAFASRWAMSSGIEDHGLDPARCILHMPCVPTPKVTPPVTRESIAAREGAPVRMVFIGNEWKRKGGPRLVRWHQARWKDRVELHVCSGQAALGSANADRSCTNIIWHGKVEHAKLVGELLPSMDLCVIPTWEDTFLIAAQEAQAAGLPVVSTRIAGVPEVVLDGQTGFLVDRRDDAGYIASIDRLLLDRELRLRLSLAALHHAHTTLDGMRWHTHLLDQLVTIARGAIGMIRCEPPPPPTRPAD